MKDNSYELPPLPEPAKEAGHRTFAYHHMRDYAIAAVKADRQRRGEPVVLDRYDAGYLGGQDGMPAYVWHDIIRSELDRAYDFYMDQIDRAAPQPAEPVKLECPKCGADRSKVPCAGELMNCHFKGEAQSAEPVKVPSDAEMAAIWDEAHKPFGGAPFLMSHVEYSRALLARYGSKTGEATKRSQV